MMSASTLEKDGILPVDVDDSISVDLADPGLFPHSGFTDILSFSTIVQIYLCAFIRFCSEKMTALSEVSAGADTQVKGGEMAFSISILIYCCRLRIRRLALRIVIIRSLSFRLVLNIC